MSPFVRACIFTVLIGWTTLSVLAWEDPKGDPFFGFVNAVRIGGMELDGKFGPALSPADALTKARLVAANMLESEKSFTSFANDPDLDSRKRAVLLPLLRAVQDESFQRRQRVLGTDYQNGTMDWAIRVRRLFDTLPLPSNDTLTNYRLIDYPKDRGKINLT